MSSYQLKIYHIENKVTKEIRKFTADSDIATNYEYLSAKIRTTFPDLVNKNIELFWIDNEGDLLTISSNEELMCAWNSLESLNGILKIYTKEKEKVHKSSSNKQQQQQQEHQGVICDGCDSKVRGIRYKCTRCYDFDLCSTCEEKNSHPSDHELLCIKTPKIPNGRAFYPGFSRRCHQQRFPWRGTRMFYRVPVFDAFYWDKTQGGQCKKEGENQEQRPNTEHPCSSFSNVDENLIEETIGTLASCFGLDPEVAKCYFATFCDEMKAAHSEDENKDKEESSKDQKTNEEQGEQTEEKKNDVEEQDQQMESELESSEEPNYFTGENKEEVTEDEKEEGSKNEENNKSTSASSKPSNENNDFQQEMENMVRHFSEQFGLQSETQQNIQGGLNSLLQGMFNFQQSKSAQVIMLFFNKTESTKSI